MGRPPADKLPEIYAILIMVIVIFHLHLNLEVKKEREGKKEKKNSGKWLIYHLCFILDTDSFELKAIRS